MEEKKYFVEFGYSFLNANIIAIVCGSKEEAVSVAKAIFKGSGNENMYCEVYDEEDFHKVIAHYK